jgi:hypothetical protein
MTENSGKNPLSLNGINRCIIKKEEVPHHISPDTKSFPVFGPRFWVQKLAIRYYISNNGVYQEFLKIFLKKTRKKGHTG